jgi:hypothetical protein
VSAPTTWRVSDNEVGVAADGTTALDLAASVLQRLGKVQEGSAASGFVQGRIKYGLQSCKTRVSVRPDERGSILVIQAKSDDIRNAGGKNATQRLSEGLLNLNNPGYQPDRRGMSTGALVGSLCAFVILLIVAIALFDKIVG